MSGIHTQYSVLLKRSRITSAARPSVIHANCPLFSLWLHSSPVSVLVIFPCYCNLQNAGVFCNWASLSPKTSLESLHRFQFCHKVPRMNCFSLPLRAFKVFTTWVTLTSTKLVCLLYVQEPFSGTLLYANFEKTFPETLSTIKLVFFNHN